MAAGAVRFSIQISYHKARLAQSVERQTLNLVVVGSSPTVGDHFFLIFLFFKIVKMIHC